MYFREFSTEWVFERGEFNGSGHFTKKPLRMDRVFDHWEFNGRGLHKKLSLSGKSAIFFHKTYLLAANGMPKPAANCTVISNFGVHKAAMLYFHLDKHSRKNSQFSILPPKINPTFLAIKAC
uniref:Uncharacterized protein n=1 Tax=Romanomermis culicivorax TaxID=13658 RepID=A0A915I7T6_ROMCU